MKFLIIIVSFLFSLNSCSNNQEGASATKKEKKALTISPKEFAINYCNCLSEKTDNIEKCNSILKEAEETFGKNNKEAEREFSEEMQNCLY
jgi:hypothetical protein